MGDVKSLLLEAERKGLRVLPKTDGGLRVEGPRRAESTAKALLAEAPAVVAELRRRECFAIWVAALGRIADRWEAHAKKARSQGRAPSWLNSEPEEQAVRAAILAGDLEATTKAVGKWEQAWSRLLDREGEERP